MSKKRKIQVDLRDPGFLIIPFGRSARSPQDIVNRRLFPPPDVEDFLEFKAITVRPQVEIVAFLDGCADVLGMSRNALAVELLDAAVMECVKALPIEHRRKAVEVATAALEIEPEFVTPGEEATEGDQPES